MAKRIQCIALLIIIVFAGCVREDPETTPLILLKTGAAFTADGSEVPPGGVLRFGLSVSGGGGAITNLVVKGSLTVWLSLKLTKACISVTGDLTPP